jgi:hypothetical protein
MKSLALTVTFVGVLAASAVLADDRPLGFATLQALKDWAVKGQAHLGGTVEILASGTNQVAIACRSFTSGVPSSDLWAFIQRGERWEEALRLGPYWGGFLRHTEQEDWVSLSLIGYSEKPKKVGDFSISALCLQYPEGLKRAEPGGAPSHPIRPETNSTLPTVLPRR